MRVLSHNTLRAKGASVVAVSADAPLKVQLGTKDFNITKIREHYAFKYVVEGVFAHEDFLRSYPIAVLDRQTHHNLLLMMMK